MSCTCGSLKAGEIGHSDWCETNRVVPKISKSECVAHLESLHRDNNLTLWDIELAFKQRKISGEECEQLLRLLFRPELSGTSA